MALTVRRAARAALHLARPPLLVELIGLIVSKLLRLACWLVVLATVPLGILGFSRAADQLLRGSVAWTDFLNLYTGAALLIQAPGQLYSPAAQHAFEQALTEPGHPYLGFFLPPSSAPLVGWLGWLPYGVAYGVWLGVGLGCVVGAAWLLGDSRRGRLAWLAALLLWLPILEGLGQGQTSALLLLGMAALARGLLSQRRPTWLWLAVLACTLKPQFGLVPLLALALDRRLGTLVRVGLALAALTLVSLVLGGPTLLSSYRELSSAKLAESLTASPDFLPGPTLLHAMQRLVGSGPTADALGLGLDLAVLGGVAWAWRGGLAVDRERRLLQVALLPLAAVLMAPYALVHELSCWPVAVWLLESYTRRRPISRAVWLLLSTGIWVTGDLAVIEPNASRGADLAALLGLVAIALLIRDLALMPERKAARLELPTIGGWAASSSSTTSS